MLSVVVMHPRNIRRRSSGHNTSNGGATSGKRKASEINKPDSIVDKTPCQPKRNKKNSNDQEHGGRKSNLNRNSSSKTGRGLQNDRPSLRSNPKMSRKLACSRGNDTAATDRVDDKISPQTITNDGKKCSRKDVDLATNHIKQLKKEVVSAVFDNHRSGSSIRKPVKSSSIPRLNQKKKSTNSDYSSDLSSSDEENVGRSIQLNKVSKKTPFKSHPRKNVLRGQDSDYQGKMNISIEIYNDLKGELDHMKMLSRQQSSTIVN